MPADDRPAGVGFGAVAAGDPEPGLLAGEEVERCESPVGVCLTGVGSGGRLTDGVETVGVVMLGVVMLGVEMLGVVMPGVVMLGVVTGGVVTEGIVTAGSLTVGTETVGSLIAGTPIAGTDAAADAAVASSAPQATSTATPCRRTGGRTSHRSPPNPSPTEVLDIANRLRTGPLIIGLRARNLRLPHARTTAHPSRPSVNVAPHRGNGETRT